MDLRLLIRHLKESGVLKTPQIIEAFLKIDRKDFLPEDVKNLAYIDEALPIGEGQTISQPYTVAFMLELLQPQTGDNILDIGLGSGWQAALLAEIISQKRKKSNVKNQKNNSGGGGKIYSIEIIPEICKFGLANVAKYNFIKKGVVEIFCQNAFGGLPEIAEKIGGFDKIIAAAAIQEKIPKAWKKQLKIGGRLVIPIKGSIWLFIKKTAEEFESQEFPGFAFVPFVKR
jgi:protein-L-isoaspartate(D-aspartate) O-methyltransferase